MNIPDRPLRADILGERARLTPNDLALVVADSETRLTYQELDARAHRCARFWSEDLGLRKGDRVGILAHNRVEFLDAFFAAGKSGIILVTLGTRLTAPELEHIVKDCQLRALIYGGELAEVAGELRQRVGLEHWVALDKPLQADDRRYADGCAQIDLETPWHSEPVTGEDVYCLLYTSGTTGRPKGVMIPHRQVVWNGFNTILGWQLRSDDISPIFTPLYHAGGLMAFLVPIFMIGGTIVLHHGFDAAEIWGTIERERCTVVLGVPTIWKMLMEAPEFEHTDLSHLRWLISGGAPLPHYLIEAYQQRGVTFKQGFGMTEVGVNCFAMTVEDSVRKAGSIGQPMMYTEVRLIDENGVDVPTGEVGELLFRGPHVCRGYWNNPEATAKALDPSGWFHSGDQARCDEDGFYYVAGRQKDMIISGGVNIYPAEIEGALLLHPEIEDVAVLGVPNDTWGEIGVAYLVLRPEAKAGSTTAERLGDFLAERLARFKIPKHFRVVDALPRTAYGKVVKGDLRQTFLEETV